MNIGIIGSGHIGATLSRLFAAAGHKVALSNLRGNVAGLGDGVQAMNVHDAVRFGKVAILAVPFKAFRSLKREAFGGRIVIDASNYYPQRDGYFGEIDSGDRTSSELVAAHLPSAQVIRTALAG